MQSKVKSFLGGAAVAMFLLSAGGADAAQDRSWAKLPVQNFDAHGVLLDHVVADVTVNVRDGGKTSLEIQGPRYLVNDVQAQTNDGTLSITGPANDNHNYNVWDVSKWFDYSDVNQQTVRVWITVPRGSDVTAKHMIGDLSVGDTNGHLSVETITGDVKVGRVTDAKLKVVGGGDISVSAVQDMLSLDIAGSGDVHVGNVGGSAAITVAGSGDSSITSVGGGLNANIAGSGDLKVGNVNGPVTISMAGSGDISIAGGKADPLKVSMVGGGDLSFGGTAVNPTLSSIGSGDVWINAYTGHLSSSGMGDINIGKDHHYSAPPAPPAPPSGVSAPPAPPAPLAPPHHHHGDDD
jgi:Putative auto-transporter adhesin, head GIN domain